MDLYSETQCIDENRRTGKLLRVIRNTKTYWLGQIFYRNCLQLSIIDWKVEGMRGWGRRKVEMLDDVRNRRSYRPIR